MAFTTRVTKTVAEGSTIITNVTTYVNETSYKLQETVADASTDTEFLISIDISELQVFAMQSTKDMTVKTNSSSVPLETFTLTANKPLIWETGDTAIFSADVTSIFVTNASGSDGRLNIIATLDN